MVNFLGVTVFLLGLFWYAVTTCSDCDCVVEYSAFLEGLRLKSQRTSDQIMVTSAVLGAAVGTGLALVVAMTILLYHYYVVRRRNKDWGDLERFEAPHRSSYSSTSCLTRGKRASVQSEGSGRYFYQTPSQIVAGTSSTARSSVVSKDSGTSGSRASVSSPKGGGRIKRWDSRGSRSSTKSCPPMYTFPQQEFNVDQEQRIVQPLESSFASLPEVREISSGELSTVASPPAFITTTKVAVHKPSPAVQNLVNSYHQEHRSPIQTGCIVPHSSTPIVPGSSVNSSGFIFGANFPASRNTFVGVSGIPPPLPPLRKDSDPSYSEMLTHQSRSLPTGPPIPGARLNRTPSISSQGQNNIEHFVRKGHRGSSPAIRTFTPEGLSSGVSPPDSPPPVYLGSRSPSPLHVSQGFTDNVK